MTAVTWHSASKVLLFLCCMLPLAMLVLSAWQGQLGANPVETLTRATGEWGLRMLLLTLTITPLRQLSGWSGLLRYRRMLGLFAFFYACLHFSIYLVFDHYFDLAAIAEDVLERPYITVGFSAFVLLIPLAITSTRSMMRRLGRRWQQLHRLIYACAIFTILHFLWLTRADYLEPLLYGAVLAALLAYRAWRSGLARLSKPRPA